MNRFPTISLEGVLLFSFAITFTMKYRISPGETPYWLFSAIFVLLLSYFFVKREKLKTVLVWVVIILSIGSALFTSVVVRHQVAPVFGVHDIILQLESAVGFFLAGTNPYATTYFGTPLEEWHYSDSQVNPALFHFVMPPFYLLFSLPFYAISTSLFGFFDGRLPLIFAFFGILTVLSLWVKPAQKTLALSLFAFNPGTIDYFIEGRSDFFMHFFLIASLWLLYKKHYVYSSIFLALAFGVKQSVWPIFPLYWFYVWLEQKKSFTVSFVSFSLVFLTVVLPFLVWDTRALLDSTVLYLTASGVQNYPISGYGFGMLMKEWGIIQSVSDYFPFTIFQILFGLPVLVGLIVWIQKNRSVRNLLFAYGIFLLVFWYFSRYFNNSHLGYISSIFITSYFIPSTHEVHTKV